MLFVVVDPFVRIPVVSRRRQRAFANAHLATSICGMRRKRQTIDRTVVLFSTAPGSGDVPSSMSPSRRVTPYQNFSFLK